MEDNTNSSTSQPPNSFEKNPLFLWRWVLALCFTALGTTIFTEIQGQWFNLYVKNIGGGLFGAAILVAFSAVFGGIFYLIFGTISDNLRTKLGRRVPLYVIGAISTAILMALFVTTPNYIILIILGGILIATTVSMCHVTYKGLIPDLVPQERRGRVNTILFITGNIASLIVWIPAIILIPGGGQSHSLAVHQIVILCGALILQLSAIVLFLVVKEPAAPPKSSTWIRDLKNLLNYEEMRKQKNFFKLFIAMLFPIMGEAAFMPFLLILLEGISLEVRTILIALPFVGVSIGVGLYLIGKYTDKIGRKKIALICILGCPIGQFVIAFLGQDSLGHNTIWLLIGFGIMMPFYLGIWISTDSWTQDLLPVESRGRFLGIISIGYALGKAPGVLIAGWVGDTYGTLSIFLVAGVIIWIGFLFFLKVPETLKIKKDLP